MKLRPRRSSAARIPEDILEELQGQRSFNGVIFRGLEVEFIASNQFLQAPGRENN